MIEFLMSWLYQFEIGRQLMGGTYIEMLSDLGLPSWYAVDVISDGEFGRVLRFEGSESEFTESSSFIEQIRTYA